MKDPVRLLEGAGSERERELLRAAAAEEPPQDGAQRLFAALGLSAGPASAAPGTAGEGASAPPGAEAGAAGAAGSVTTKLVIPAALLAGVAAAALTAVLVFDRAPGPEPAPRPRVHGAAPEPAQAPPPRPAVRPEPPSEVDARDLPAKASRPAARTPSIAREIEQLDAAREHLHAGHAQAALAVLDAYRREHPQGALRQEAQLLQIQALVRRGERVRARRLAQRFLREHPQSPHAGRVRALLVRGDTDAR